MNRQLKIVTREREWILRGSAFTQGTCLHLCCLWSACACLLCVYVCVHVHVHVRVRVRVRVCVCTRARAKLGYLLCTPQKSHRLFSQVLYLFGKFSLSTDYFTFLRMNGNSLCTSATYPLKSRGCGRMCAGQNENTPWRKARPGPEIDTTEMPMRLQIKITQNICAFDGR